MKTTLKRFLYYFTALCFLFTGTVLPLLTGMKVFAQNDIDVPEPILSEYNNSSFVPAMSDSPKEITNALDLITITKNDNTGQALFEWRNEGNTTKLSLDKVDSASYWKLTAEWSIKDGTDATAGDYFTLGLPAGGVFDPAYLAGSGEIRNNAGDLIATYEIISKNGGKEAKITLTDFVEERTNVKGDFWCVLFVGYVEQNTFKTIQLIVNGGIPVSSNAIEVTGRSYEPHYPSSDYAKWVNSGPAMKIKDSVTGKDYYYFSWTLVINLTFGVIDNFYFRDEITQNSPHIFITGKELNCGGGTTITLSDDDYAKLSKKAIYEYIAADNAADEETKRQIYFEHYNNGYFMHPTKTYSYPLQNGASYPEYAFASESGGIPGIFVSGYELEAKRMYANLGKVTRPMYIQYYTIATQEFTEDDLVTGSATANTIGNVFYPMEKTIQSEKIYGFQANHGGNANGTNGTLTFTFQKVNISGESLEGAWFGLFTDPLYEGKPFRKAVSDRNGTVIFDNMAAGEYYIKETAAPTGYITSDTVYKVILTNGGCNIFDGETEITTIINEEESTETEPAPSQPATTDISVKKEWDDAMNQDGLRPDSVEVQLFADGTARGEPVTLTEEKDWSYTWEGLPEYKDGVKINYTVKETLITGYNVSYRNDGGTIIVTNSYIPEQTSKTVSKVWDDANDRDRLRPHSIEVQLYADGAARGSSVTLSASNNWRHTWAGLPVKSNGKAIVYTVREITNISGYVTAYSADTFTITNSHNTITSTPEPTTEIPTSTQEEPIQPPTPEPTTTSTLTEPSSTAESAVIVETTDEFPSEDTPTPMPVPDSTVPSTDDEPVTSTTVANPETPNNYPTLQTDDTQNNIDEKEVPLEDITPSDKNFKDEDVPDTIITLDETIPETTVDLEVTNIPSPQTGDMLFPIALSVMSLSAFAFLVTAKRRL